MKKEDLLTKLEICEIFFGGLTTGMTLGVCLARLVMDYVDIKDLSIDKIHILKLDNGEVVTAKKVDVKSNKDVTYVNYEDLINNEQYKVYYLYDEPYLVDNNDNKYDVLEIDTLMSYLTTEEMRKIYSGKMKNSEIIDMISNIKYDSEESTLILK